MNGDGNDDSDSVEQISFLSLNGPPELFRILEVVSEPGEATSGQ